MKNCIFLCKCQWINFMSVALISFLVVIEIVQFSPTNAEYKVFCNRNKGATLLEDNCSSLTCLAYKGKSTWDADHMWLNKLLTFIYGVSTRRILSNFILDSSASLFHKSVKKYSFSFRLHTLFLFQWFQEIIRNFMNPFEISQVFKPYYYIISSYSTKARFKRKCYKTIFDPFVS